MFYLDKDMERVMQKKKRDVINELEAYKNKILQELSGVDKITLTRLRQILADYNSIQQDIKDNTDTFREVTVRLNEALEECEAVVNNLNGIEKTKIIYADKLVDSTGSIDEAITYAESLNEDKVLLKLGSGVYTFSRQFKPSKCIVIEGCGSSQTTLKFTGTASPAVVLADVEGCGFRGIGLYGGDVNNRVDGIEIKCEEKTQTGGHVLEDIWIRYFKTGLRIGGNVFTMRANYIRIYECSEYGLFNDGTDNQFLYLCTQGCNLGNYYGGANNAYSVVYSIFDGKKGEFSNKLTGNRNHFAQFTTQDSYQPLLFDNFNGTIYGQFDAIYHATDADYVKPEYLVKIVNRSVVNGELRISSYRTETMPKNSVYVDNYSVFNGKLPHDVFIPPYVTGVINDTHGISQVANAAVNPITGAGASYTTDGNLTTMSYVAVEGDIIRNGFRPDEGKTWIFTGEVRRVSGSASALKVFNDSGNGEAYQSKTVLNLTDEYQPFYVAVHRNGTDNVSLMVEGLTSGSVEFKDLKAFDVTGIASKRFFSIPSCYSVFN